MIPYIWVLWIFCPNAPSKKALIRPPLGLSDVEPRLYPKQIRLHRLAYRSDLRTWIPKVCNIMACGAMFNGFGPLFYILVRVRVLVYNG